MVYTADEEYDIFISYAAADNEMPAPYDLWVTHFVDFLGRHLKARLGGEKPKIYFDQRSLEPNHVLQEILGACRRSKIFLAIASTAYHSRKWTRMEVEAFVDANPEERCVFVVELPKEVGIAEIKRLQPGLGRHVERFYREDFLAKTPVLLRPGDQDFYIKQSDFASSLVKQLVAMKARNTESEIGVHGTPQMKYVGPVLLAQTTDDLEDERQMVRRYLEQYGVSVLPISDYAQGGPEFRGAFGSDLEKASLVVQLLGPRAGRIPPDLPMGYARFQANLAQEKNVPLMQWRRSDVQPDKVLDATHRELLTGVNVIASTLQQFNKEILKHLEPKPVQEEKTEFLVFVNAERSDMAAAKGVRAALKESYWVYTPQAGQEQSIQSSFNQALGECDVLLTLYGSAGCEWVTRQMFHLRKARAGKPSIPVAICIGPPPNKPDVGIEFPGSREVNCRTPDGLGWSVETLKDLLSELRK